MAKFKFEQIAFNSVEKKKPTEEDKYHYIGLEHLDSGSLMVSRYGSEIAPIGEKLIMKKGDVLFGKRRAYQKKVAIAPFDGIFSAHGMVLRPKTDVIDADFFPLFISSDYFLDKAIKISVGSLSPTINWKDLKELEFDLPPLKQQHKIAEVLWAIINSIESYKNMINKTRDMLSSYVLENFSLQSAKNKKWITLPFDSVFEDSTKDGNKIPKEQYLNKGKYPIIDQSQETISGYWNDDSGLYKSIPAIIFGDHTRVFKFIDEPFFLGADGVKLLKLKDNTNNYKYMYYFLLNCDIPNEGYARHFKWLKKLLIVVPPSKIQNDFEKLAEQTEGAITKLQESLNESNKIYLKIIKDCFYSKEN